MALKYTLNDVVATAIMANEAVIIVEGKDDRQIYQRIADKINITAKVYEVKQFENYGAGCDNVIQCLHVLQPKFEERADNIKRIMGIIDRDVRPYRTLQSGEIDYADLIGLFVLKYYSIETYFATKNNLKRLLAKVTYALESEIDTTIIDFIEENFNSSLEKIYYISLECLKKACVEDYEAVVSYKKDAKGNAQEEYLDQQILPKKEALDDFAVSKQLEQSQEAIQLICKGKWYLYNYIYRAIHQINQLKKLCKEHKIPQCERCKVEDYDDCRYTLKQALNNHRIPTLCDDMLEFIDEESLSDVIQRMKTLG